MTQPTYEQVAVGDEIPVLQVDVSRVQMFFFSAATYNGHRIHYDTTWATDVEGYPDLLIHGPLQVALATRAITDWMGPRGRLLSLSAQNRGSAYAGDGLRFGATVVDRHLDDGTGFVDLEFRGQRSDGTLLMPGTASVALPTGGGAA